MGPSGADPQGQPSDSLRCNACLVEFTPNRAGQRFCSKACSRNASRRTKRGTHGVPYVRRSGVFETLTNLNTGEVRAAHRLAVSINRIYTKLAPITKTSRPPAPPDRHPKRVFKVSLKVNPDDAREKGCSEMPSPSQATCL